MIGDKQYIKAGYFLYCKWCHWDGRCRLRHYRFLGVNPGKKIDNTPYQGHEDLEWHLSAFQGSEGSRHPQRAMCRGRIFATGDAFFPLSCECGTSISSLAFCVITGGGFCAKFMPSEQGKIEMEEFERVIRQAKKNSDDPDVMALLREFNWDYYAVMD